MCILCESKQKTYLSTNQKNDYHTLRSVSITESPRLSFCLSWHFFFSCLPLDWVGEKKTNHHPQNPQQRMRAVDTDNLQRCDMLQERSAPNFTVRKAAWGDLPGLPPRSWLSVCQEVPGQLQEGQPCSHFNLQQAFNQWVMKNGICTKWREKALFL